MRIVVRDKRFRDGAGFHYLFDEQIDYVAIQLTIPLTPATLKQYRETKSPLGYAAFKGLNIDDIKSILSAVKRREARVNVDRMGVCAYYKLIKYEEVR